MPSLPETGIDLPLVPTSIPGLDTILYGGLRSGGLYLVTGSPGSGKTILGNQMAFSHVAAGGRAVYVTLLAETQARMLSHLRQMEFFNPAVVANTLYYIWGYKTL
jgi:circadian clock protein KaiC